MYRARDAKLGRDIALKILPPELASHPEALRRFEQEARAASALNHPNIVTIYDIGQHENATWIAMELIDGADLRTLAAREPLSLRQALRIAVKIADGLAAAHDRGIVHRDLKPDNVMITPDGFVKILDFGLAKQMRVLSSEDTTIPHTSPGTVFGTVGYMSPEQACGREMDARSDQFSFGVMLYEMLTRVRPFDRDTKPETMTAILRDDVEPPSSIHEGVPYDLDRIVSRCLAKDPRERYASTRDLARDLREVRDTFSNSAPRLRSAPGRPRTPRRVRLPHVLAAALVVAVLAGGAFMGLRRGRLAAGQRVTSVAVLPFRDLSGTPEGRVLADGISELIATRLAAVKDLRVSSPFEGVHVADTDEIRDVAKKRGVHAVVRGTIQRDKGDVRVTYLLFDAEGETLASRSTTRAATDLFALEDAVAEDLVHALGREVAPRVLPAAAALDPQDQRRFVEAVGLLQRVRDQESVDRAITTLESILRNTRESGVVNAMLARALLYKANLTRQRVLLEQATVYATRGVTLSGDDPEAHLALGRVLNATQRYGDAVAEFHRVLALRPHSTDALTGLGDALEGLGRGADAEKMYRKAIALKPDSAGAHSSLAVFCFNRGRYEEAVQHFRSATELTPDLAVAHANLGGALHMLGRYDEAMASYRKSLALAPTANGWSNLGTLQFSLGRYDEARRSYERATALAPSDVLMWANLGDACRAIPDAACARRAWEKTIANAHDVLSHRPGDAVTRAILASSLAKNGQTAEAQTEIGRALEADPTDAVVLYQAAIVSALRGSPESAVSWLERAVANGYPAADAQKDPVFAAIRDLPSFRNALKSRA